MTNRKGRFVVQERGANYNSKKTNDKSGKADLSCRKGVLIIIQKSQINGSIFSGLFPDYNERIPKCCVRRETKFRWLNYFCKAQYDRL